MRAAEHTERMIRGWERARVHRADLAVRRRDGAMLWQRGLALEGLPLGWARAENARGAEVYIRPARGFEWPLVFLDDLPVPFAQKLARDHGALVVRTSPEGGCHVWLPCDRSLDEEARLQAQRDLAAKFGADKASVSGEHLGRLAGFKNWKRGGCWINVLCEMEVARRFQISPATAPAASTMSDPGPTPSRVVDENHSARTTTGDGSPSGVEWGWVCRLLESGKAPEIVCRMLVDRAASRRGADAERYATRTVEMALARIQGSSRSRR